MVTGKYYARILTIKVGNSGNKWYEFNMEAIGNLAWDCNLSQPPQVVAIARNVHGRIPVECFRLPELWSLHLYGYGGRLDVAGRTLAIEPGNVSVIPPGQTHTFTYEGMSAHTYAHFRLPPGPGVTIPAMSDPGSEGADVRRFLDGAILGAPARQSATIWSLLWRLSDGREPEASPARHPAVDRALAWIEAHLNEPFWLSELAATVEVSPGYLSALFHGQFGVSAQAYVRQRRLARAHHLLAHSTLPIKSIAARVGIPDLQAFNKAIRATYGAAPRELRNRTRVAPAD